MENEEVSEPTPEVVEEKPQEALDFVKEASEPSKEDAEKMQQLQAEVERLQNVGVFRTELLYQLLGINSNLERIASSIDKVTGGNQGE